MCKITPWLVAATGLAVFPGAAPAEPVSAFVPGQPWEVRMEIRDFEPYDALPPKVILGGSTADDLIVTITNERETRPLSPDQVRAKYCPYDRPGGKTASTREYADPGLVVVSTKGAESVDHEWHTFDGYAARESVSFNVHVSADLFRTSRDEVVLMIRSFEVNPSPESGEAQLLAQLLKVTGRAQDRERLLQAFIKKFPRNAWSHALLGGEYLRASRRDAAEEAFLQALAEHRGQPINDPAGLWLCYDGLGLIYGTTQRYEPARLHFERAYQCARAMQSKERLADSAYHLACLFAETGAVNGCFKFLREAIELNPAKRAVANKDPSFAGVQDDARFQRLVQAGGEPPTSRAARDDPPNQ